MDDDSYAKPKRVFRYPAVAVAVGFGFGLGLGVGLGIGMGIGYGAGILIVSKIPAIVQLVKSLDLPV
jgi:hypothetical protein